MTTKDDYVRTDEIDDASVPIAWLPRLFNVSERTIRTWLEADGIETYPHPTLESRPGMPDKAVRFGDIPLASTDATRWKRR